MMGNETAHAAVTSSQITVQSEEAQAILKKIRAKTEEIREQKKFLEAISASTESCWAGLSGDALREKLATLVAEQEAIAQELEHSVEAMANTIQQLVDKDAALAAGFRRRVDYTGR